MVIETVKVDHGTDRPFTQIMAWPQAIPEPSQAQADVKQIDSPKPKSCEVGNAFTEPPEKRKASQDPQHSGRYKPPRLPLTVTRNAEVRKDGRFSRRFVSMQSQYDTSCEIDFGGGYLSVIRSKTVPHKLLLMREVESLEVDRKLALLNELGNEHFVACVNACETQSGISLIFEHMNVSLVQINGCPRFPTEEEVVAIVGQVRLTSDS